MLKQMMTLQQRLLGRPSFGSHCQIQYHLHLLPSQEQRLLKEEQLQEEARMKSLEQHRMKSEAATPDFASFSLLGGQTVGLVPDSS